MKFTPLASSSRGNAYLVEAEGVAPLLLEAGIPIRQLREKVGFRLSELAGCLVSHEHGDHSKAVIDLLKAGVDCAMSIGTAQILGVHTHHRLTVLRPMTPREIGPWRVLPFNLEHDAQEPLGFIIGQGNDRLLFIPDTAYVKNTFSGITLIAVECNFIDELLTNNILRGALPPVVGRRVRRSHLSLDTVIGMLRANDLSKCREIWLLHLSDGNSDEAQMVKEVQQTTGIPTRAA